MKPNLPDTHDHENTNHLACHSPSLGWGRLEPLGSGERNLSRASGTKVAQQPSERARASQRRGEGEQPFAEGAKKSLSLCPLYLLW